jgi:hypothetical protein
MNSNRSVSTERSADERATPDSSRRRLLTFGASVGETAATAGTFRLLISDQPIAIDEFESLEVSLDRARIFRRGRENDEDGEDTPGGNETATATATPETEDEDGEGFSVVDLDGATVDLTRVVGDRAITVFDGELPAGRYTKIELYAADVGGVVDGDAVDVTIPSGKLQLTKPFEVGADEPVEFVFDINVVKRGQSGGYNLLSVVSESGVAGRDVSVTEVADRSGSARNGSAPENASEGGAGSSGGRGDNGQPTETEGDA